MSESISSGITSTQLPPQPLTAEQTAILAKAEQDLAELRRQIARLEDDQVKFQNFVSKARKGNLFAIGLALVIVIAYWIVGGSGWVRWYLLPITFVFCGIFAVGSRWMLRWVQRNIAALNASAQDTESQLVQLRAAGES